MWYFLVLVDYGVETIGSSINSRPNPRSRDTSKDVWVPLPWRGSQYYWVESTSISSMAMRIPGGMVLDRVTEVEVVCGDGSCDLGETADDV